MKKLISGLIFLTMMVITACGGGGGGDEGTTTEPDTPTNVRAMAGRGHVSGADVDYNYVVVRWNASSGADSYTIYYDTDSAVTTASDKVTGETNTYHLFTNAPADFNLYFAVTASNSAGESDLSSVKRMAVQIAATGQTTSYAANDDGDLEKGVSWSTDRFIYPDAVTTLDTMTGLMWQNDIIGTTSWSTALSLTATSTIGGYLAGSWRLPNRRELMSLMDYSSVYDVDVYYWTSTTDKQDTDYAWAIDMVTGLASSHKTLSTCRVQPVRDAYGLATAEVARTGQFTKYADNDDGELENGVIWPSTRFTDNGDGTVTDILTGLMWLQDPGTSTYLWANAVSTAAACTDGGYADWRLPNVRELESLLDMSNTSPCLPNNHHFLNYNHIFWTSTTKKESASTSNAWYINFSTGSIQAAAKSTSYYVWPVRSTQ